jgi:hypothetical protein
MTRGERIFAIAGGLAAVAGVSLIAWAEGQTKGEKSVYTTPVTDASSLKQIQTTLASLLSSGDMPALSSVSYTSADVDGDASNPRWIAALSAFQKTSNVSLPWGTGLPPGMPARLRTDGVLDYATAIILINS